MLFQGQSAIVKTPAFQASQRCDNNNGRAYELMDWKAAALFIVYWA